MTRPVCLITVALVWSLAILLSSPLAVFHSISSKSDSSFSSLDESQNNNSIFSESFRRKLILAKLNRTYWILGQNIISKMNSANITNNVFRTAPRLSFNSDSTNKADSLINEPFIESACMENWPTEYLRKSFTLFIFVIQFIIPALLNLFCYTQIFQKIKTRNVDKYSTNSRAVQCKYSHPNDYCSIKIPRLAINGVRSQSRNNSDSCRQAREILEKNYSKYIQRKTRANIMLISMMITFCLCWMPLHAVHLAVDFLPISTAFQESRYFSLVFLISHIIAMCSTLTNPFLYALLNEAFRNCVIETFQRHLSKDLPAGSVGDQTMSRVESRSIMNIKKNSKDKK